MRSKQLDLEKYDTDKIASGYLGSYEPVFEHLVDKEVVLLELGVHKGGSLLLWRDYFPRGTVVGVDIKLPIDRDFGERILLFEGSQTDREFLTGVAGRTAPGGFDIIIDDASHIGELTRQSFWHLFDNHLKPGGIYVIEDWGTGYWEDWIDGKAFSPRTKTLSSSFWGMLSSFDFARRRLMKTPARSHLFGMVGFVKELVDELGAADASRGPIQEQRQEVPNLTACSSPLPSCS